jgi:hypothetical protein
LGSDDEDVQHPFMVEVEARERQRRCVLSLKPNAPPAWRISDPPAMCGPGAAPSAEASSRPA